MGHNPKGTEMTFTDLFERWFEAREEYQRLLTVAGRDRVQSAMEDMNDAATELNEFVAKQKGDDE